MKNFFYLLQFRVSPSYLLLACVIGSIGCTNLTSETKGVQGGGYKVTGRTSMSAGSPTQCSNTGYDVASDTRNGHPIAGVDGKTFGTLYNGGKDGSTMCNKCVKTSDGLTFAVDDRIWENDGEGNKKYGQIENAEAKTGSIGEGESQIDISKKVFEDVYHGHNPKEDVTLEEVGC